MWPPRRTSSLNRPAELLFASRGPDAFVGSACGVVDGIVFPGGGVSGVVEPSLTGIALDEFDEFVPEKLK
jgi:hypothetical protein